MRDRRLLRAGLLVDLENLSYTADGCLVSPAKLGSRLDEVLCLAGFVQHRIVAAQRHMLVRYGPELALRNLRWLECPAGPDQADRTLLDAGAGLVSQGFTRLVVASGDHYFAQLGDLCDLEVAAPRGVAVAAHLAAAGAVLGRSSNAQLSTAA